MNIVAAVVALVALKAAARPGTERHHFGLSKAEYFSALFEGLMILIAAGLIMFTAIPRFLDPQPLEDLGIGLLVSGLASALNFAVATILMRAGLKHRSIVLQADSKHLMTDVWTSGGVIVAVLLVGWTGWLRLDPLIAMAVALNIVFAGLKLIGSSAMGLLDASLPAEENALIVAVLRHRQSESGMVPRVADPGSPGGSGSSSMHMLVPGAWSVHQGHDLLEAVEEEIRHVLPDTTITAHLKPVGEPEVVGGPTLGRGHHPRRRPLERQLKGRGRDSSFNDLLARQRPVRAGSWGPRLLTTLPLSPASVHLRRFGCGGPGGARRPG